MPVSKIVGFDFLPGRVRAVAVSGSQSKFNIHKLGEISIPVHDEAPEQFFPDEVSLAIKDWVKESGLKGYKSAFCFQERKSILRVLSVPKMEEQELAYTIRLEFSQVMEENIDNYSLDFTVLSEEMQEEGGRQSVLVAIVPKSSLYPFIDSLETSKLPPVRASLPVLSSITSIQLTKPEYLEGNLVCVHLEVIGGDVLIFQNGELALIRRISLGLNELKYAYRGIIESKSPADVEDIGGFRRDDYVVPETHFSTAKPLVDMVYAEIERTLSFFKSQRQSLDYTFDRIIFCGNGIWPMNLDALLQKELTKPVILANTVDWARTNLSYQPSAEEELDLARFSVALGVALEALR